MSRWKSLAGPAIAVGLLSWVACSDAPVAGPEGPMFKKGDPVVNPPPATVSGPVWVTGTFELLLNGGGGGGGFAPGENAHPQAGETQGGTCRQANGVVDNVNPENNTTWFNGQGNKTNAKFCQGSGGGGGGSVFVCTIDDIPATYAFGGAGGPIQDPQNLSNENLNFNTDLLEVPDDLFIHYQNNSGTTNGKGILPISYTCDDPAETSGTGTIDLDEFDFAGNLFRYLSGTGRQLHVDDVSVVTDDHGVGALTSMEWQYRSRIPND